ncbi:hypothetical protein QBC46DRAFT_455453 [Diplogelasinospora grovesii]|uniref:F-box domain-containing protein n=1 Tax=Diplogelasinospora grovesii TaxID=303347 RepID=A0AAN6S8Q6_9PEZI|nr:hypothetical protein QBC46DRAFT_455453 [Diplogelasinospora grovesii]
MSTSRLEQLPAELLRRICEYIAHSHRPTVLSFALASKRCRSVAKRLLFHTISFAVDNPPQLARDVLDCTATLQRNLAFADVYTLVIHDSREHKAKDEDYDDTFASRSRFSGLPLSPSKLIYGRLEPRSLLTAELVTRADSTGHMDAAWQSLAHLVRRLQALADVLIWMRYEDTDGYDGEGMPSYHADAVDSMVRGLAPNLKEVHLFYEYGCPEDDNGNPLPPRAPWRGFAVDNQASCTPARLECLELGMDFVFRLPDRLILEEAVVHNWAVNTELSSLRTLMISRTVNYKALNSLMLVQAYYDDVKRFLRSLSQLTSLEIIAWDPSISLAAALYPRLLELWLRTQHVLGQGLDEAAVAELADRCPAIETLALEIRRSRGDATEVALYRALGRFAHLRRLALTLDASPPPWFPAAPPAVEGYDTDVDPSFDEFDRSYLSGTLYPYRHGHIRDILINTAVDETLARAIFRTICAVQTRNYTHGVTTTIAPLERMKVQVAGGKSFPHRGTMVPVGNDLSPYLAALGRQWLLERDVRDDARDVVHAREFNKKSRLRSMNSGWAQDTSRYLPIFRRIWPEKPSGLADWRDDWWSWPLITETT